MTRIKLIDENLIGQPGLSPFIDPNVGWLRDGDNYDVAIYTDRYARGLELDPTKKNYAWIIEPPIINGENYDIIATRASQFVNVFTHIKWMVAKVPNAVFIPHGGTWLRKQDIEIWGKSKSCSFIFSDKAWNPFHRKRHEAYDLVRSSVDCFGSGCNRRVLFKTEALKEYRFSIVMENSIEEDYFTEKLLDCFLSGTIPIYHGCKNIGKYFDLDGVIQFDSVEELPKIIEGLTEEVYAAKWNAIVHNFVMAHNYVCPERIIHECITGA